VVGLARLQQRRRRFNHDAPVAEGWSDSIVKDNPTYAETREPTGISGGALLDLGKNRALAIAAS
jgi:hypothetical protein